MRLLHDVDRYRLYGSFLFRLRDQRPYGVNREVDDDARDDSGYDVTRDEDRDDLLFPEEPLHLGLLSPLAGAHVAHRALLGLADLPLLPDVLDRRTDAQDHNGATDGGKERPNAFDDGVRDDRPLRHLGIHLPKPESDITIVVPSEAVGFVEPVEHKFSLHILIPHSNS